MDARTGRNIVLMRPVGSIIEFEQIIGRGTRLFDSKDHFTIYDFVRPPHHFNDPEWDGEPTELAPAAGGGGDRPEPEPPGPGPQREPPPRPINREVKLANGKSRQTQSMSATYFWSANGTPTSSAQFLQSRFGALPEFFQDEEQPRTISSDPATRKNLPAGLADKGFSSTPLAEMQKLIEAENSDLFDVLAYVAFETAPETRAQQASKAPATGHQKFNDKQQAFVDFVLVHYVLQGVDELDADKLTPCSS